MKGVGEPPTVVSTAAVVSALRAATGRELTRVPVRPDDIAGTLIRRGRGSIRSARRRSRGRYVRAHQAALVAPSTSGPARGHAARPRGARPDAARRRDRGDDLRLARLGHGRDQLYRPAEGDFEVTTVHGNERRAMPCSARREPQMRGRPYLAERFLRRGAYLIPHDEADWDRPALARPGPLDQLGPRRLAPRGRTDRPDARCRRHAARRRLGRRAGVRSAPDRRGARRARRLRRARDRGAIEGVQVAAEAARDRAALAPAARRLRLAGRARLRSTPCSRPSHAESRRRSSSRRSPSASRHGGSFSPPERRAGSRTIPDSTSA